MKRRVLPILVASIIIMIAIAGLLSLFDELSGPFGSIGPGQGKDEGQSSQTSGEMQSNNVSSPSASSQDGKPIQNIPASPTCSGSISCQGGLTPAVPLFRVRGSTHTALLRSAAASSYNGKLWNISDEANHSDYQGEELIFSVSGFSSAESDRITITPLIEFSPGFIPTSLYATQVSLQSPLVYYPEELAFYSASAFSVPYEFSTTHYYFDESTLNTARVLDDKKYLELPGAITERTKRLAIEITQGLDSPYAKAKAIESYLQRNYEYNPVYQIAPQDWEPNDWFLFEEKKGVCANFNSALAVLCRTVGIPARLVTGFTIQSIADEQVVKGDQAHEWIEVAFEDLGWIAFDATAPGGKIPTVTHIDSASYIAKKGYTFEVEGEVLAEDGYGVDKMPVEILINETNARGGTLVGNGETSQGHFKITCTALPGIRVGDYYIIAHSLGNDRYAESWSVSENKLRLPATTPATQEQTSIPTPIARAPTTITITASNTIAKKGYALDVSGKVTTSSGDRVDDVKVEVFLNKTKDRGGTVIGSGNTSQGYFMVSCQVPKEMSVGEYQIIAHALADNLYSESWSDPDIKVITATKITLYLPQTIGVNRTITISGSLTEEFGEAVSNQEVLFLLQGKGTIAKPITTEKGEFSFKYTFDQIGTYNVTAEFKGTSYFLASSSSAEIRVLMPTSINLQLPEKALTHEPVSIEGSIKDANGSALVGETITIITDSSGVKTTTGQDGTFSILYSFDKAGVHKVEAKFDTSQYYLASSSSAEIEILSIPLDIQTSDTFVRNEEAVIQGTIGAGDKLYPKESVLLLLDGLQLAEPVADQNGKFQFTYHVPTSTTLGPHTLEYRVPVLNIAETQNIVVKARTSLILSAPAMAKPGDHLSVKAALRDDLRAPMGGANIISQTDGLSAITDGNGTASFGLDIPANQKEPHWSFEYRFLGTSLYLPCSSSMQISLASRTVFPWWVLAFIPVVGISGGYLVYRRRKNKRVPSSMTIEEAMEPDVAQLGGKNVNISINFPQIEKELPDVWGLNDGLDIELLVTDGQGYGLAQKEIEVHVDGIPVAELRLDDKGRAELVQAFSNKGDHLVVGKFSGYEKHELTQVTRTIRIVDYREEIVALFNSLLAWAQSHVSPIPPDATPREIEQILVRKRKEIDRNVLDIVISCFEEADYSTHEIYRKHYRTMFVAQKQVKDSLRRANDKPD